MTYETISLRPQKTFSNIGVHSRMMQVIMRDSIMSGSLGRGKAELP